MLQLQEVLVEREVLVSVEQLVKESRHSCTIANGVGSISVSYNDCTVKYCQWNDPKSDGVENYTIHLY